MLESIKALKELLKIPAAERNLNWARSACETGRKVRLNVWAYSLPNSTVKRVVLKLYDRSITAFEDLDDRSNISKNAHREIRDFRGNAIFRRYDLANNYLEGKSPELATYEKLKELGAR